MRRDQGRRPCLAGGTVRAAIPVLAISLLAGCALGPRLDLAELAPDTRGELLADTPFHPDDSLYCGPAALLTVLEASGISPGFETVSRHVFVPGLQGSLQTEMMAASRHFGRIPYVLAGEPAALLDEIRAGRPVLVLQNLAVPARPSWHYAVVIGFDPARNLMILRSGETAALQMPAGRWLRTWDWAGRWAMVTLAPGELPARLDTGRMASALADFERVAGLKAAEPSWAALAAAAPDTAVAWLGVGNAAFARDDYPAAEQAFLKALDADPDYLPGRINLAYSYQRQHQPCAGLDALGRPQMEIPEPLRARVDALREELRGACAERDEPAR